MSESAAASEEAQQIDVLGMSDEDAMELDSELLQPPAAEDEGETADEDNGDDSEEEGRDDGEEESKEDESGEGDESDADDSGDDPDGDPATEGDDSTDESSDSDEATDKEKETGPDHKEFYDQLTAPFKANGKSMKVDNADDAIRLMQMGANYNRKMAALKPALKSMKMLEKNDLLDESKLSFLIDLDKKNPAAIAKLLKDSKLDPVEMDLEQGDSYKASNYEVGDNEVDLDAALESIKDSETYSKTLNVVGSKWDAKSKQIVADAPELLEVIDEHMASGIYDLISTEVEQERMFGRLKGMSDIQAYQVTGDKMHAAGKFNHLGVSPEKETPSEQPKPAKPDTAKARDDKRKKASPSKPAAPAAKKKEDFNPLGMSDEQFMKEHSPNLL